MIYSLSDTHLDGNQNKPMDIFGEKWINHKEKITNNWINCIREDDFVLICGDVSWALKLNEAIDDLKFIDSLPGKKIITRGNHDFWWSSLRKMNDLNLKSIHFLQNDSIEIDNHTIVGSRGWMDKSCKDFTKDDLKIFDRELIRIKLSLDSCINKNDIICMLHYPPFDLNKEPNEIFYLLKEYNVNTILYGHLHGMGHINAVEGIIEGIEVRCTSADYINFCPVLIRR